MGYITVLYIIDIEYVMYIQMSNVYSNALASYI